LGKKNDETAVPGNLAKERSQNEEMTTIGAATLAPQSAVESRETAEATTAKEPALEDNAFSLLVELGKVRIDPDPRSPDYDHSKDDEFSRENIWLVLQ